MIDENKILKDEVLNSILPAIKGEEVYLVGGYLRNLFLKGEISSDRDLVTTSSSFDLARKIADFSDAVLVELDAENEIYRVVLKDKTNYFDILRMLDNDILKDAKRRDFTINSIYFDLNKKDFFDPMGGILDIENKIIKTFDLNNLKDDPLRFLRAYRFYSLTGFEFEAGLEEFLKKNFSLVKNSAFERINCEIIKIFEGEFLVETLLKMLEDNVLEVIFPFVCEVKKIPSNSHHHLDLIHHLIETVKNLETSNPLLKIAAFYHDIGKPKTWSIEPDGRHRFIGHDVIGAQLAHEELEKLKFSTKQINYITKMIKYHIYPSALMNSPEKGEIEKSHNRESNKNKTNLKNKAFARFVRKIGSDSLDLIALARADRLSARGAAVDDKMIEDNLAHLENLEKYYKEIESLALNPKALLDGREIMEILDLKPSKRIGELLEKLKIAQMTGEISTKDEAICYLKKI